MNFFLIFLGIFKGIPWQIFHLKYQNEFLKITPNLKKYVYVSMTKIQEKKSKKNSEGVLLEYLNEIFEAFLQNFRVYFCENFQRIYVEIPERILIGDYAEITLRIYDSPKKFLSEILEEYLKEPLEKFLEIFFGRFQEGIAGVLFGRFHGGNSIEIYEQSLVVPLKAVDGKVSKNTW